MAERIKLTITSMEQPKQVTGRYGPSTLYKFKAKNEAGHEQEYSAFSSKVGAFLKLGATIDAEVEVKTKDEYTNYTVKQVHTPEADAAAAAKADEAPPPPPPAPRPDYAVQAEQMKQASIEKQVAIAKLTECYLADKLPQHMVNPFLYALLGMAQIKAPPPTTDEFVAAIKKIAAQPPAQYPVLDNDPKTAEEMLVWAWKNYQKGSKDVCELLGVKTHVAIKSVPESVHKIRTTWTPVMQG